MTFWRAAVAAAAFAWSQSTLHLGEGLAQEWPQKPVRIMVGFGAGGGTDIVARTLAERLSSALGQQFVVENKPGAGGTIAGGLVAKADPDGYTALVISTGHAVSAITVKQVPYDPVRSFEPVGIVASSTYVVVVPKSSPATDLKSLIAHINQAGGKLNYSTVNVGSTQHLIAEDIRQRTGMNARHLAVRTTGDVITALLRGDAAFAVELYHAVRGQVEAGELRLIAVSTAERWPPIPGVPTLAESGLAGFGYSGWYGMVFPAGTPKGIIDRTRKALAQELAREDVQKKLEGAGASVRLSAPEELSKVIARDLDSFRAAASKAGVEPK